MADDRIYQPLEDLYRRESRSFLQYIRESFPWTETGEEGALARLQTMAGEEQQALGRVALLFQRRRNALPYVGQYPMEFTTLNFVSLDHLLPLLAEHTRRDLAEAERDLSAVTDPEARAVVQSLMDAKRGHLQALEELATAHPEPAMRG